jgi:periplasmic divalent cation tolerance protein
MSDIVLALTTVPAEFDPTRLAEELVGAGLAACVTIVPAVRSVYRWKGAVETGLEQQLLIKTTGAQVAALWSALKVRHPYQVPEFVTVPVAGGHPEYLAWIRDSVSRAPGADRP